MSEREQELIATLVRIRDIAQAGHMLAMRHSIVVAINRVLTEPEPAPDTRPKLTARQAEYLDVIRSHIAEHGYSPTFRELQEILGFASPNSGVCHAKALAKKGYLRWSPVTARSFVPIGAAS